MLVPVEKEGKTEIKYIFCAVIYDDKSFLEIFSEEDLSSVCLIELPKVVPNGFHGKWDLEIYNWL